VIDGDIDHSVLLNYSVQQVRIFGFKYEKSRIERSIYALAIPDGNFSSMSRQSKSHASDFGSKLYEHEPS
jgi:hypothetical protein